MMFQTIYALLTFCKSKELLDMLTSLWVNAKAIIRIRQNFKILFVGGQGLNVLTQGILF